MKKVIKFSKEWYNSSLKYNNIYQINNALALTKHMSILNRIPKRKMLREHIMRRSLQCSGLLFDVSHKDIKRMERASKCEIPVNIVDILDIIWNEVIQVREYFPYRANDNATICMHAIGNTVNYFRFMIGRMYDEYGNVLPQFQKYQAEIAYVEQRIREFENEHPETFDSIF